MSNFSSLEERVIVALRRITRASDLHSRGLLQRFGLTAPQLAALHALGRLQPVTIGGLAKSIHLSQATLTGILHRLESRSLITRRRSGTDRRNIVVELTDAGRAILAEAPSLLQERFRAELHRLQEWEQTQMLATLQRIAAMMHADELASAPPAVSSGSDADAGGILRGPRAEPVSPVDGATNQGGPTPCTETLREPPAPLNFVAGN